jgi:hypothetical protein
VKVTNIAKHLARFADGQIEVSSPIERAGNNHACGQIKSLRMEGRGRNEMLYIELEWAAMQNRAGVWVKITDPKRWSYKVDYPAGHEMKLERGRLYITPEPPNEFGLDTVTLYPKSSIFIDRSRVRGL